MGNVEIIALSPDEIGLESLETKWVRESPFVETAGRANDYKKSIREHLETDIFREDDSVHNKARSHFYSRTITSMSFCSRTLTPDRLSTASELWVIRKKIH